LHQEEGVPAAGDPAAAQEDEDAEEWAWDDLPTDVEATIMLLRGQLRAAAPAMPPVVLHTHLYATLKYVPGIISRCFACMCIFFLL
jgi:hypothetical protein